MVEVLGNGDEGGENNVIQEARSVFGTLISALSTFAYYVYTWGMKLVKQVIYWASKNPYAFTMFMANTLILLS